jgi:sphingosine kinase
MDFHNYQGIICCSGDGIVHEVINAIFHREDKEEFMHCVPIGVIPGGTSNGYAKSICEASGEVCNAENCVYIISKGQVKEVDILEIETSTREKKIYSFLSVSWGIIADIDLESETCRCCGPMRYSVYGAFRWMCLRNYYGALYYLPESSTQSLDDIPSLKSNSDLTTQLSNNDDYNFIRENGKKLLLNLFSPFLLFLGL